jgi:hypothetical protein
VVALLLLGDAIAWLAWQRTARLIGDAPQGRTRRERRDGPATH